MKPSLLLLIFAIIVFSCKNKENISTPKDVNLYTIEQFYENIRLTGGFWSADESKLLVSSDETGIYNVYQINIEDGT